MWSLSLFAFFSSGSRVSCFFSRSLLHGRLFHARLPQLSFFRRPGSRSSFHDTLFHQLQFSVFLLPSLLPGSIIPLSPLPLCIFAMDALFPRPVFCPATGAKPGLLFSHPPLSYETFAAIFTPVFFGCRPFSFRWPSILYWSPVRFWRHQRDRSGRTPFFFLPSWLSLFRSSEPRASVPCVELFLFCCFRSNNKLLFFLLFDSWRRNCFLLPCRLIHPSAGAVFLSHTLFVGKSFAVLRIFFVSLIPVEFSSVARFSGRPRIVFPVLYPTVVSAQP